MEMSSMQRFALYAVSLWCSAPYTCLYYYRCLKKEVVFFLCPFSWKHYDEFFSVTK